MTSIFNWYAHLPFKFIWKTKNIPQTVHVLFLRVVVCCLTLFCFFFFSFNWFSVFSINSVTRKRNYFHSERTHFFNLDNILMHVIMYTLLCFGLVLYTFPTFKTNKKPNKAVNSKNQTRVYHRYTRNSPLHVPPTYKVQKVCSFISELKADFSTITLPFKVQTFHSSILPLVTSVNPGYHQSFISLRWQEQVKNASPHWGFEFILEQGIDQKISHFLVLGFFFCNVIQFSAFGIKQKLPCLISINSICHSFKSTTGLYQLLHQFKTELLKYIYISPFGSL